MTKRKYFFIGIVLLLAVLLWPLVKSFLPLLQDLLNAKHDQALLREVFKQANLQNAMILLGLMIVSSAIPGVSSSIFCIFVGLLYGPLWAIPMNIAGNTIGNMASFEILRKLEKPEKSKRMDRLLTFLQHYKHKFLGITLAFSIPFIPSALVNYACVQMNFPTRSRFLATFLGVMPISILYAVSGDLLVNSRPTRIPLAAILVILLIVSLTLYIRHFRKEKDESRSNH